MTGVFMEKIAFPILSAVADLFKLKRKKHVCEEFFITGCELATPEGVHPSIQNYLKLDRSSYILTVARVSGRGLVENRLIIGAADAVGARLNLIGLAQKTKELGNGQHILKPWKRTFYVEGQSLYPFINVYPIVTKVIAHKNSTFVSEHKNVEKFLKQPSRIRKGFVPACLRWIVPRSSIPMSHL